MRAKNTR